MMLCMPGLLTQGVRGAARPPWPRDCIGFPPAPYWTRMGSGFHLMEVTCLWPPWLSESDDPRCMRELIEHKKKQIMAKLAKCDAVRGRDRSTW